MPKFSRFSSKPFTVKSAKRIVTELPVNAFQAQVELIGGGGGGGGGGNLWEYYSGGGGAGAYLYSNTILLKDTTYSISVGTGGLGAPVNVANDGSNAAFGQNGGSTTGFGLTALGGGGGTHRNGLEGASGGGAGGSFFNGTGGNALQGNPGGNGSRASAAGEYGGGGGGGGAGSKGADFSGASFAAGGAGTTSVLDSVLRCQGGRAGGGSVIDSSNNTGSGGSGGNHTREIGVTALRGGNGGSGIIIIKYPSTLPTPILSGVTSTSSSSGGFTTLKILSGTGTIVWSEPPTYNITPDKTELFEGESVTFAVTVANVPNDTILYWVVSSNATADFSPSNGTRIVTNGTVGSISLTPLTDDLSEGDETFTLTLRTGSVTGTVVATSPTITIKDVVPTIGQQSFTTPGSFTWVAPAGVTTMSAVCIGGGGGGGLSDNRSGGGGGELSWYNNIPITPGESLTVNVGAGGATGVATNGGTSSITRGATVLVSAIGGNTAATGVPGIGGKGGVKQGGGFGGAGGLANNGVDPAGGGGAGGYQAVPGSDTTTNWTGTFTDSGTYLSVADRNDLDIERTTHCIECWVNHNLEEGKAQPSGLVTKRPGGDTSYWFALSGGGATARIYYAGWYAAGQANGAVGVTDIPSGVWTHVAMTRTGTTGPGVIRLFVNGKLDAVINEVQPATSNTNSVKIGRIDAFNSRGRWLVGQMSNVRIVSGSLPSGYSTTSTTVGEQIFTPPISGLSIIPNTVLLTLQSGTHTDVSGLGSITVTGTVPLAQSSSLFATPANGGQGSTSSTLNSTAGVGGAGGGGGYGRVSEGDGGAGYGGGGVGLLGAGSNGAAGLARQGGRGGSGGATGTRPNGGLYGGGSGGNGSGGNGAVRIIWGNGREYPSSGTANVVAGQYPIIPASVEIVKMTWEDSIVNTADLSTNFWPILKTGGQSIGSVITTPGPYGSTDRIYRPVYGNSSFIEIDRNVFTSSTHDSYFVGNKSFSFEWWGKHTYPSGGSGIYSFSIWGQPAAVGFNLRMTASNSNQFSIVLSTSNLGGTSGTGVASTTISGINDIWTHFVVAWKAISATQGYFYVWINGVLQSGSNTLRTKSTDTDFYRTSVFPVTAVMQLLFQNQQLTSDITDFRVLNTSDYWVIADEFPTPTSPFTP